MWSGDVDFSRVEASWGAQEASFRRGKIFMAVWEISDVFDGDPVPGQCKDSPRFTRAKVRRTTIRSPLVTSEQDFSVGSDCICGRVLDQEAEFRAVP